MQSKPLSKNIILLSDGTGNSAASPHKTNVWRTYKALDLRPGSGQVAYYDNGVGTSSIALLGLIGKVFGFGLRRNVLAIYRYLCRAYEEDARIYGYGFSRGAFTMRVVMAFVANQGLVDRDKCKDEEDFEARVEEAYKAFRKESFSPSFISMLVDKVSSGFPNNSSLGPYEKSHNIEVDIQFIGVWDTVEAYGFPIDELRSAWDTIIWPLVARDRDCSGKVKSAFHALALDEQRLSFSPTLWNERGNTPGHGDSQSPLKCERVQQVWFPGVHADIGGGYPDDILPLFPLRWILKESVNQGLRFLPSELATIEERVTAIGPIHDSRDGIGFLYRYEPRNIETLSRQAVPSLNNVLQRLANSARHGIAS